MFCRYRILDGIHTRLLDIASLNLLHFQSVFDCSLFYKLADKINIHVQVSCFVSCLLSCLVCSIDIHLHY